MSGITAPETAGRVPESRTPEVSVVIPCLNEAGSIANCVLAARNALADGHYDGEVVVVDNGSTDGSGDLATAAGARVIDEPRRGYGNAYLTSTS
jgi:glycosyltransferase involved in cell wall biosynthesis